MSLDKTKARLDKLREQNRQNRKNGVLYLTEPGPWHTIPQAYQFDPAFFRGFLSGQPPPDNTRIGDSASKK